MKTFFTVLFVLFNTTVFSQQINGQILDSNSKEPIIGATIRWENSVKNAVQSDENGNFSINKIENTTTLIISSVGYKTATFTIGNQPSFIFNLTNDDALLEEVKVKGQSSFIDKISPIQTEVITTKTLAKAACCNLSESFETNASVSVNYSDAITGAKQLQLLGLTGNYILTTAENIPTGRGLAVPFGLNFIPGTWIQSIDLGKGAGTVVNGFESMVGAINVEFVKPDLAEKLYLNTYLNHLGRGEINLQLAHKLNKKWSVGLLTHGSALKNRVDKNGDGFMDLPTYNQVNVMNRWKYSSEKMMAQFGFKYLKENRLGGQNTFESTSKTPQLYGFTNHTNRIEVFSKTAKLFPKTPYRGLGLIVNAVQHQSDSQFGNRIYDANQQSFYSNLIYQDIFSSTTHTFKTGLSWQWDKFNEKMDSLVLQRTESVPGFFFEYTYNLLDKTILVLGSRVDYHNLFGVYYTPRVHFKQDLNKNLTLRISVGKGYRTPNFFSDSYGNLISGRKLVILDKLKPEISWNYGTSLTYQYKKSSVILDFYRTDFKRKLIVDAENPSLLYYYFSEGKTFSNSAQIEFNYNPTDRWEFKLAYRYLDAKQTMGKPNDEKVVLPVMMVNRDRVLANVAYALPYDKWKVDFTVNWNGKRRVPHSGSHTAEHIYSVDNQSYSPSFATLNAQLTRTFVKWEVYLGGENLTDFRQLNPLIEPENPFGNRFDAAMAWGPVVGRVVYLGIRYRIKE